MFLSSILDHCFHKYIGSICSEPLLQDRVKFPDSIFTASNSLAKHEPAKARLSSHSSWCTPSNSNHYLDIDLSRIYVINSLTTFGDSLTKNWVSSYQLRYTRDRTTWTDIKKVGIYFTRLFDL